MLVTRRLLIIVLTLTSFSLIVFAKNQPVSDDVSINFRAASPSVLASNRYTQMEDDLRIAENPFVTLDGTFVLVGENDTLALYANEDDLSFRLLDKASGYLWGSSFFYDYTALDEEDNPLYPNLFDEDDRGFRTATWNARVRSPLFIGYYMTIANTPQYREESLFQSEFYTADFKTISGGYSADVMFGVSNIKMTVNVFLNDNGLSIEIPYESIIDGPNAKLSKVSPFPFFGAVKKTRIPGYVFVPDGIGALIRFDETTSVDNIYEKRFYGSDYGISMPQISATSSYVRSEERLYANVYGMVHGIDQNGFAAIVNQGAPYASITVYPANITTDFYWTFTSFRYRNVYRQPLNQSNTNSILLLQSEMNLFDVKIDFIFLNGEEANYIGMAKVYQNYLLDQGVFEAPLPEEDIPLHLDVLAGESKSALFGRKTITMTTTGQLNQMIDELKEENVSNLVVSYLGYSHMGLSGSSLNEWPTNRELGAKNDFIDITQREDIELYFYADPTRGYEGQGGYNGYDLATQKSSNNLLGRDRFGSFYYISPSATQSRFMSMYEKMEDYGMTNVSFGTLGNLLYSSYGRENLTRVDSQSIYKDMISAVSSSAVYRPFDYFYHADHLFDVPMYTSQQAKFNDTVPFIPYVLAGFKNAYGRNANFFSNTQNELLRLIDYHLYPSFY
ncbi:MAG: hypothetical protein IH571_03350, partial [Acholeplasmataceae bacterium]|nr:hypothetical protein [Acholeplasmataceae bacterium]